METTKESRAKRITKSLDWELGGLILSTLLATTASYETARISNHGSDPINIIAGTILIGLAAVTGTDYYIRIKERISTNY